MKPPKPKPPRLFTASDQENWTFWHEYISDNGGYLTSLPGVHTIRFEVKPDSILPQLLESAGLDVANAGTTERLLPATAVETRGNRTFATQSVVPTQVSVWQFSLPLAAADTKAAPP
jgi:hypothetical protein